MLQLLLQWYIYWNSITFSSFLDGWQASGPGIYIPDSKVHKANMGPIWGRQDPGGPHDGPMNFALWDDTPQVDQIRTTRTDINLSITVYWKNLSYHLCTRIWTRVMYKHACGEYTHNFVSVCFSCMRKCFIQQICLECIGNDIRVYRSHRKWPAAALWQ